MNISNSKIFQQNQRVNTESYFNQNDINFSLFDDITETNNQSLNFSNQAQDVRNQGNLVENFQKNYKQIRKIYKNNQKNGFVKKIQKQEKAAQTEEENFIERLTYRDKKNKALKMYFPGKYEKNLVRKMRAEMERNINNEAKVDNGSRQKIIMKDRLPQQFDIARIMSDMKNKHKISKDLEIQANQYYFPMICSTYLNKKEKMNGIMYQPKEFFDKEKCYVSSNNFALYSRRSYLFKSFADSSQKIQKKDLPIIQNANKSQDFHALIK